MRSFEKKICAILYRVIKHSHHQPTYLITHHPRCTHNQQRIAPNSVNVNEYLSQVGTNI